MMSLCLFLVRLGQVKDKFALHGQGPSQWLEKVRLKNYYDVFLCFYAYFRLGKVRLGKGQVYPAQGQKRLGLPRRVRIRKNRKTTLSYFQKNKRGGGIYAPSPRHRIVPDQVLHTEWVFFNPAERCMRLSQSDSQKP